MLWDFKGNQASKGIGWGLEGFLTLKGSDGGLWGLMGGMMGGMLTIKSNK